MIESLFDRLSALGNVATFRAPSLFLANSRAFSLRAAVDADVDVNVDDELVLLLLPLPLAMDI